MKRNNTKKLVLISLCIGINVIGALIAVTLKLPIFLDTIGTFLIAFLFGPIAGIITGILSYLITTMTFDPYALYFIPSQITVGLLAGIIYKKGGFKKKAIMPFSTLLIAICQILEKCAGYRICSNCICSCVWRNYFIRKFNYYNLFKKYGFRISSKYIYNSNIN